MAQRSIVFILPALPVLLGGCLAIEAPEDFVVLDRGSRDLRAVTPDEARLRVRDFRNPEGGDLAFWSKVLKKDFVEGRGYALIDERKVADNMGREGEEFLFAVDGKKGAYRYLVRISLVKGTLRRKFIRVAEFAAPPDVFVRHEENVRTAFNTIRP